MRITVKKIEQDDLEKVIHLHKRIFDDNFPLKKYEKKATRYMIDCIFMIENDEVVGYLLVLGDKKESCIHLWLGGVVPEYQKQGIYTQMMKIIIHDTYHGQYENMTAMIYESRYHSLLLHLKLGFLFEYVATDEKSGERKIFLNRKLKVQPHLRISITDRCNYNCFFCHGEGMEKKQNTLSTQKLENILVHSYRANIRHITFTGGEPLLQWELLAYAMQYCGAFALKPSLTVVTNASLLTKEMVEAFASYKGELSVNVSLHSFTPETYRHVTGVQNHFHEVIEKIKWLRENGVNHRINYVVLKGINDSLSDLENAIRFCIEAEIKKITFIELLKPKNDEKFLAYHLAYDEMVERVEALSPYFEKLERVNENLKKTCFSIGNGGRLLSVDVFRLTCSTGCEFCKERRDITIGADGYEYICFMDSGKKRKPLVTWV